MTWTFGGLAAALLASAIPAQAGPNPTDGKAIEACLAAAAEKAVSGAAVNP